MVSYQITQKVSNRIMLDSTNNSILFYVCLKFAQVVESFACRNNEKITNRQLLVTINFERTICLKGYERTACYYRSSTVQPSVIIAIKLGPSYMHVGTNR